MLEKKTTTQIMILSKSSITVLMEFRSSVATAGAKRNILVEKTKQKQIYT